MLSVLQTNFNGIDGLTYQNGPRPQLTDNGVIIKMSVVPISPTDWKLESDAHATNEQLANLPRVIGIQGAGRVIEVGKNRNQSLLNQRVLVVNPSGVYSEYVLSENPDWIFPLPDNVSNDAAAALSAGTALTIKHEIDISSADNLVITGANSVIGLTLLQMIDEQQRKIYPVVTAMSKEYFQEQMPGLTSYTREEVPQLNGSTLIVDIVGKKDLLNHLATKTNNVQVVSIALMKDDELTQFKFIHDEFSSDNYRRFINQLSSGQLKPIINKTFPVKQTKEAQHFAKETHSRGRVLVNFDAS